MGNLTTMSLKKKNSSPKFKAIPQTNQSIGQG